MSFPIHALFGVGSPSLLSYQEIFSMSLILLPSSEYSLILKYIFSYGVTITHWGPNKMTDILHNDITRWAISDTTHCRMLCFTPQKPDPVKQIFQEILVNQHQRTRLLQLIAISLPQHCPGVMLTPTAKLPDGVMGEATPWPRQLQHPFLRGPHAWHLPKGLDFSLPSLCSQVLNINQWPSYLFPKGLISLFQQPSSTKCKELSAAQLMQSSPKSQQPCSMQIFGGYLITWDRMRRWWGTEICTKKKNHTPKNPEKKEMND